MKKKVLLIALAAILLVGASIGGTLAWLTATASVTNTFTVGNVGLTMTEPNYVTDEKAILIPGGTIAKDPTVTVSANSEECYVFVKVTNELSAILDSFAINSAWQLVSGYADLYQYNIVVPKSTGATQLTKLFESIKVMSTIDNDTLAGYANKQITVQAFAIQNANITMAEAISAAANALSATTTP